MSKLFRIQLFAVIICLLFLYNIMAVKNSGNNKYYINIPDSPKTKAWLEIDYISNDTIYCNWYTNQNNNPKLFTKQE